MGDKSGDGITGFVLSETGRRSRRTRTSGSEVWQEIITGIGPDHLGAIMKIDIVMGKHSLHEHEHHVITATVHEIFNYGSICQMTSG